MTQTTPGRVWITTAQACELLGVSRESLRRLRLRGILKPGRDFRRWGCTDSKGLLQWHAGNIETALTSWSRRNLRL
jgi:hypothetical protein